MTMKLETKSLQNNAVMIRVTGEINMDSASKFRKGLEIVLDRRPTACVLSMGGVNYMDSAGLAVMIEALRYTKRHKVRFVLAAPSQNVLGAVELGQLNDVFEYADSEQAAFGLLTSLPAAPTKTLDPKKLDVAETHELDVRDRPADGDGASAGGQEAGS